MSDFVDCSLKPTLGLKPEPRLKWLVRAVAALKDGAIRVSDVYDIIAHPKFVNGIESKIGTKMRRALSGEMDLFSDKQRSNLQRSELFKKFPEDAPREKKPKKEETDEGKMDEMMARCRAFVKDNENLYEVRQKELDAEEDRKRQAIADEKRRVVEAKLRAEEEKLQEEEDAREAEEQKREEDKMMKELAAEKGETEEALARLERELRDAGVSGASQADRHDRRRSRGRSQDDSRDDSSQSSTGTHTPRSPSPEQEKPLSRRSPEQEKPLSRRSREQPEPRDKRRSRSREEPEPQDKRRRHGWGDGREGDEESRISGSRNSRRGGRSSSRSRGRSRR